MDSILNDKIMKSIPQRDLELAEEQLKKREKKSLQKRFTERPRFAPVLEKPEKFDTKIVIVTES